VDQAINVFLNGLGGVFAGMAVLYLTIKLLSFAVGLLGDAETPEQ
jgi:hypothetical protein